MFCRRLPFLYLCTTVLYVIWYPLTRGWSGGVEWSGVGDLKCVYR